MDGVGMTSHDMIHHMKNVTASVRCRWPLRVRGVTLVELLIGLVVMAILLSLAVPSFQSTIAGNRVTSVTNDLVGALAAARSEAIRRQVRVTVCKSANSTSCTTTGDWEQGWIIFTDTTRAAATASVDGGEQVLVASAAAPAGITIKGNASAVQFVSYAPDGQPKTMAGASWSGKLQVCSNNSNLSDDRRARLIDINTTGRVVTTTPTGIATNCSAPT